MIKSVWAACVLCAGVIGMQVVVHGQVVPKLGFADVGTAIGTTNSHYVITANGRGRPVVSYISATSDKAGSFVEFWKASSGAQTIVTATNASQAVVWVPDGSKFAANDTVVIRHITADSYERKVVSSQTSTNITLGSNLGTAIIAGDVIYKMTQSGKIPVGAATKEVTTTLGAYHAPAGLPVLVQLDGTSACTINLVTGEFK